MSEILLKLGGEGGGIEIIKNSNLTYALKKQEMSYEFDDGSKIEATNKTIPLNSMTEVIEILEQNQRWLFLYPLAVHEEIKIPLLELLNKIGNARLSKKWERLLSKP